ncbi:alpha/beta hydrolase family protein [Pedobacter sp. SAFR-022]|uniref:alpha/beta hydrolase family protein n=1 Tax=Pedobacter sp. SAFR-022 TaxID=3436861 RepID=UPI003F81D49E
MKKNFKRFAYLLLFVAVSASCKKDKPTPDPIPQPGPEPAPVETNYVSAAPIKNFTSVDLKARAAQFGFKKTAEDFKYDVDYVKLVYKTTYKGKVVNASGLLGIPKNTPTAPSIISAQHGTIFVDDAAPTNMANNQEAFSGHVLLASAGFITAVPDYIGYGDTKDLQHPYYDQEYAATAVLDMLKATKAYLAKEKIATSNRLFLTGYSEGGYITMAAQKEIEGNAAHGLTLTAVSAGAGAYDLPEMLNKVANASSYDEPGFLATLLISYNSLYEWNRPLTDFYKEPYASRLPGLLDGTKNRGDINKGLDKSTAKLFNNTFFANLQKSGEETKLKEALDRNSFNNWTPKTQLKMFHGTKDEAVFISTSKKTYDRFLEAGAKVDFKQVQGTTHQGTFMPMLDETLEWFLQLDK